MGLFGDLWNGIRNTAGKVWGGIKDVAGKVYNTVGSGLNWVREKVQPIVEGVANFAGKIPVIGAPIASAANTVNNLINQGAGLYKAVGDIGGRLGGAVESVGRAIGGGNVVDTHKAVENLVGEGARGYNQIRRPMNSYQR